MEQGCVKIIKSDFEKSFRKDVKRLRRWLSIGLFLRPKLRKVGNPLGLLHHVEDYTLRELDLRNEIQWAKDLQALAEMHLKTSRCLNFDSQKFGRNGLIHMYL